MPNDFLPARSGRAPNVLLVLIDGVGFGATTPFGGPIATPTLDAMASAGLKYHRFQTAGLTQHTRTALLTGRAAARVHGCASLADILRLSGFMTAQFGTWPDERQHVTADITNTAIEWLCHHESLASDAPFFMYFNPAATDAPRHALREWGQRYAGRFDRGWDALREEIAARQQALGLTPRDGARNDAPDTITPWTSQSAAARRAHAKDMEAYAGRVSCTDHYLGVLLHALAHLGILERTLVCVILADNDPGGAGAPRRSLTAGWTQAMSPQNSVSGPDAAGAGVRGGAIVRWGSGIAARGLRSQLHHVIDVAPTVLDVAGVQLPTVVHGVIQRPLEGVSMSYSFGDASAPDRVRGFNAIGPIRVDR